MGRIIVEQIISADGYAAEEGGGIGFFHPTCDFSGTEPEQMRMMATVGAIVFGATTYRMFADYWPGADAEVERVAGPINALPKFVVSSTLQDAPWGAGDAVEILRGEGVEAVRAVRARIAGDLILWGSLTLCDALLRAGEIDVLRLRIVPVLIGRGRSFAPGDLGERRLSLVKTDAFAGGIALLEYAIGN
ncbi:MAG: dihydrofolate reductase family protein [Pseudoxanthomonas sp.]